MLKELKGIIKSKIVTEKPGNWGEGPGRGLPVINPAICEDGCTLCQDACPTGSLYNKAVDPGMCIYCHRCVRACPGGAITGTEIPLIEGGEVKDELGRALREKIKRLCKRSLHIRYVDAGACNGCDFEINAITGPVYDIQQYGVDFVASPRHADMLLVTGSVTRNLETALKKTYEAAPGPVLVVAVGACACGGGVFKKAYAAGGGVGRHVPVDVFIPGCPPTPAMIIQGILKAVKRL
ncbi:MAG: NADH-quinone oxidoreductase subunit NuoB [Bacillota bacterium]